MPSAVAITIPPQPSPEIARTRLRAPLPYTSLLGSYKHFDSTPVIGREFEGLQVVDILAASNSDALIRDLAVTGKQCHKLSLWWRCQETFERRNGEGGRVEKGE